MNIHEYQAKQWLAQFGVPVPGGRVAATADEARAAAREIGFPCVVKAQIHAGGRGKAGGVKVVQTADEAGKFAESLLGKPLVTHQTGPEGRIVRRVWVEEASRIARELYCSVVLDAAAGQPAIIACREGGMEIEEVARETPDAITIELVDPLVGVAAFQVRRVAGRLGLSGKEVGAFGALLEDLYRAFLDSECMQLEVNPLAQLDDGRFPRPGCQDELRRQRALPPPPGSPSLRDVAEEDPREVQASDLGISYVALDGNIGCMVNGAGLAMGTMDIIQQYGGMPANFLDVGGGASKEMVGQAFRLLLSDDKVRGVLVNIFGGIMRCDVIAAGIIDAAREDRHHRAPGGAAAGHQRGAGERVAVRVGPEPDRRRHHRGCGAKDRPGRAGGRGAGMSILVNAGTRVLTQGITGATGQFHTRACREYGTRMVAGVTPGKGRDLLRGIPVFDSVEQAVQETAANASVIYVPPPFAADAILESADAGVPLVVCITEGVPVHDMMRVKRYLKDRGTVLVGPQLSGGHHPRRVQDRDHARRYPQARRHRRDFPQRHADLRGRGPAHAAGPGTVHLRRHRRRSHPRAQLRRTCSAGSTTTTRPRRWYSSERSAASAEQDAAEWIRAHMKKPVVGFIVGRTAPPGKRMGHAGAIISGGQGDRGGKGRGPAWRGRADGALPCGHRANHERGIGIAWREHCRSSSRKPWPGA